MKVQSIPTRVLHESQIGIIISRLSRVSTDEAVRSAARDVVDTWRQIHRKRRASFGDNSGPSLKRTTSTVSDFGDGPAPAAVEDAYDKRFAAHREKVRQKFLDALGKEEEVETKGDGAPGMMAKMRDPVVLASEIEQALYNQLKIEKEYLGQARSILFNLRDSKNPTFIFKLMVGYFTPDQVPKLTAEDMASDAKNAERAKLRQYSMEEIQTDWALKHGGQRITGMFTCGKCQGTKTTYFQMQTRSSDEPMTTFVSCLSCNNRWKFC